MKTASLVSVPALSQMYVLNWMPGLQAEFLFLFTYFLNNLSNSLFSVALHLHCCKQAFSSCGKLGLLFVAVHGLLIAVASLVAEHRLSLHGLHQLRHAGSTAQGLQQLWHSSSVVRAQKPLELVGSEVVAHRLSCSMSCGILLDQGFNPCPLHWQVDS